MDPKNIPSVSPDLEKTYFRPHVKKKKKGKADSPKNQSKEQRDTNKRGSLSNGVSILGAVAASGAT